MKLNYKLATLLSLICANALATPVYQPPGPNLTYGSSSNNQSIMSSVANPAAAAAVLRKEDSQYRFGIISIGAGYEVGNVNDLFSQIDNTKAKLSGTQTLSSLPAGSTPQQYVDLLNSEIVNPVNKVTRELQQDGNASLYFDGHIPFTPFVVAKKGWGGSIVLDANVSAIANISFIAEPLATVDLTNLATYASVNPSTGAVTYTAPQNDSSLLVKAAVVEELGLGYSRSLFSREVEYPTDDERAAGKLSVSDLKAGELTAGVRVKYYQVRLARDAEKQTQSTSGSQSTLKANQTYTSNSGFGLDVGTLWTSRHYRAGAWVNNLNSPSFKYDTVDTLAKGYTSSNVIAQINADGTYKMKPQLQLEGVIYSQSQNWVINAGLDANAVQDPVGRNFQWATLSAAYATNSWWIPGARVGYRTNRAGSKLSYATAGLTFFKALSLDIAYGLKSVSDNSGKSIPRSAMVNLGMQMTF